MISRFPHFSLRPPTRKDRRHVFHGFYCTSHRPHNIHSVLTISYLKPLFNLPWNAPDTPTGL